ncbi:DEAD/DEAH box helicase [Cellulomonas sp. URHD0024]|uniref:DEAD/DEAH box helicase n=1 Tax=Cellulomonas sp. URHD0024 TaxID=1302620 RepID=UPI0004292C7C|nr:DEAD/DEAH box helicase [Cellulomonas sp. URHD0024]
MTDALAARFGGSTLTDALALVTKHSVLAGDASTVLRVVDDAVAAVTALVEQRRDERVRDELSLVGVDRLGELTDKNLRLRALAAAGYATAADLLGRTPEDLDAVPGVGLQTARSVVAAIAQLSDTVRTSTSVRISPDPARRADGPDVELLRLLHRLRRLRPLVEPQRPRLVEYASSIHDQLPDARRNTHPFRLALSRHRTKVRARAALAALLGWENRLADLPAVVASLLDASRQPDPTTDALWDDFEQYSPTYYATLEVIVPSGDRGLAARGLLTTELADLVAAQPLDLTCLRVELRGYQAFGARFLLRQGRALLGDEMGLGKTMQALAAMSTLAADGQRRFLVVCPASVLVNWLREIASHSALVPHRLHGPDREAAIEAWLESGGVGVTTYEGLAHVPASPVGLLVVDEAHYVKNPTAHRSRLVERWTSEVSRVAFLTGTPMDNELEDFLALVRLLQPELAGMLPPHLGLVGADVFRQSVSPVYLRRNAQDVLVELPELVVVDEWEELSPAGEAVYRSAVANGSLMAMRRAAFVGPGSTKLERLLEIVDDAALNGRRTVVFSYFRDVIDTVVHALATRPVYGPLTGDVTPDDRQAIIDDFSAADTNAVLVAQVSVGGVGLNLQAASVAVLCEPQLTPSAEAQAFARLHRMGQVRSVRAHRLLAEGGVDERITEILTGKRELFDQFVRESSLAAGSVRAVDVTEAQLVRAVMASERARLGFGPITDGGSANWGASDPTTTDPTTTDSTATDSTTTDPTATDPGTTDPTATDPTAADRSTIESATTDEGPRAQSTS